MTWLGIHEGKIEVKGQYGLEMIRFLFFHILFVLGLAMKFNSVLKATKDKFQSKL